MLDESGMPGERDVAVSMTDEFLSLLEFAFSLAQDKMVEHRNYSWEQREAHT